TRRAVVERLRHGPRRAGELAAELAVRAPTLTRHLRILREAQLVHEQVADDENPPRLDRRGRYVGCSIPELGEQVCQVLWSHQGITYRIVIPVFVTGRVEAVVTATLPAATDEPGSPSPGETSSQTNPPALTPPTEPPPLPTLACEDTPEGCTGDD
ncbi:MAG: winged helix-turn-helix transcriptional regulator, partial [Anaerolineae bacterium]|nr:winged helix-turn-helix transcriptional regulator [Anaerolineae bacterium]